MRQVYTRIDLYSNNSQIWIIDREDKRLYHKKIPNNQKDVIFSKMEPFRKDMVWHQ